jgi:hypothetical protein
MLAASLLLATALAAPELSSDLQLVAEGRRRALQLSGATPEHPLELELDPQLRVRLTDLASFVSASYVPRLTLSQLPGDHVALLHQAALTSEWRPEPRWQITFGAEGSRGTVSQLQLAATTSGTPAAGQPPLPTEPLPAAASVRYLHGQVSAGVVGALEARWRLRSQVATFADGGADASAQRSLPLQRGIRAETALEWSAGRQDVLGTSVAGTVSDLTPGTTAWLLSLGEGWRHTLGRGETLFATAGPSLAIQGATHHVGPSAEIGLGHESPGEGPGVQASAALSYAPLLDRVSGAIVDRAAATATLAGILSDDWRLDATASGGVVVDGAEKRDGVWAGEVRAGRRLGDAWQVYLGARGILQEQPRVSTRSTEWSLFVTVIGRTRPPPGAPVRWGR